MKSRQQEMIEHLVSKPKLLIEAIKLWGLTRKVNEYYSDCPKLHIVHTFKNGIETKYEVLNRIGKVIKREVKR